MKRKYVTKLSSLALGALLISSLVSCGSSTASTALSGKTDADGEKAASYSIVNVSYDPTRELYVNYNEAFKKYYKDKTGNDVEITQSHGGSGKQALEVANGLEADVVTLALEADVNEIKKAGLIEEGWVDEFDLDSSPYTSTIVFLVRKGNPKNILDWNDLTRDGVGIVTPDPKTSGGAKWNYLAAWAYESRQVDGDETKIKDYLRKLFANVVSLESGARGATNAFVENGQGDVLLAWENEAILSLNEHPGEYEIVTPSLSILAQPSVAIVDKIVDKRGTRDVAKEYLEYLYSEDAQRIIGKNYYRPSNEAILKEFGDTFDLNVKLVKINEEFGGWAEAQAKHFDDGGTFDEIYSK
ncbi:MAG: sulfate ABC transporter substrate-binding protein [Oscillospiraceae bacterium]|nr:sulfate ABC transporter substrate-binding protein [Oscillospiraceae bacterium]